MDLLLEKVTTKNQQKTQKFIKISTKNKSKKIDVVLGERPNNNSLLSGTWNIEDNFDILGIKIKDVARWGIFKIKKLNKNNFLIKDVIEKPTIKLAPSNHAVIGRYILPKKIFKILEKQKSGRNGEIHITDAIRTLIHQKNKFIGHVFAGKYLDCGTMKGYINSSIKISKLQL